MAEEAQLQIHEFTHLSYGSLTCTVRCLGGVIRVGAPVRLLSPAADEPIAAGLVISGIWRHGDLSFIDLGMTARVTVTGAVDVAAIRAAAAGVPADEFHRLDLRLVAG
ncbi:hypothetical protein [Actinoplanes sp. NPDC049599]|uniref:hypothetical protein n=1 Tax=Actinoplanes sp. NPDC049599 TaxID=3363903 RepID=UPI0037939158